MGCTSCATKTSGVPNGCKSNGNCATGSCDKLTVFDWLSNMTLPSGQKPLNIVEVRFKNGRKHFFRNSDNLQLTIGEIVAVEGAPGHDVGTISLTGELIRVQMKKKKISEDSEEIKKIYRKASVRDIEIWQKSRDKEEETQRRGREILGRLGLKMKLSDVEYQGDGNKATFYYTAEERIDFRQLIKDFASAFSIRIEMKQVDPIHTRTHPHITPAAGLTRGLGPQHSQACVTRPSPLAHCAFGRRRPGCPFRQTMSPT